METQVAVDSQAQLETHEAVLSDRGAYRLAGAMLLQAINDATSRSAGRRAGAMRWMGRRGGDGYSFDYICRILNRSPEEVRRFCHRRTAERQFAQMALPEKLN